MVNVAESLWLNEEGACSAQHLVECSGLSARELADLIDNGIIMPAESASHPNSFQLRYISVARLARRLRDDFELDQHGVTLAMTLLRRIGELELECDALKAKLAETVIAQD